MLYTKNYQNHNLQNLTQCILRRLKNLVHIKL